MFPFSHCKYWGVGGRQEVGSQVVCTWSFWEICCFFNQKKDMSIVFLYFWQILENFNEKKIRILYTTVKLKM